MFTCLFVRLFLLINLWDRWFDKNYAEIEKLRKKIDKFYLDIFGTRIKLILTPDSRRLSLIDTSN